MSNDFDVLIKKDALAECRIEPGALPQASELEPGQALVGVDQFALTANNITYAAFGEAMHYWDFFPTQAGWGRLPVWGFADVVAENQSGLNVGERVFGFWPMASGLLINVGKLSAGGFEDVSAHRLDLPAVYNRYVRTAADPGYVRELEALQMLFRPLFMTDFLLDDFLTDNGLFGAGQIVLSSASSKTAFGLAFLLARRELGVKVIGLTSQSNVAFVEGLGCYDHVAAYGDLATLDAGLTTVYVDFAGNSELRAGVHGHWKQNLSYSCAVGGTHWDAIEHGSAVPGPEPTLFFAPAQMQKRLADWGPAELQKRYGVCWLAFSQVAADWIEVVTAGGEQAIKDTYLKVLSGDVDPQQGYVLSCRP